MTQNSILPSDFAALYGQIHNVRRRGRNEYSSSCPKCGGDGKSDRFRMWVVSKHGGPLGWCRRCNYIWTPAHHAPPTPAQILKWAQAEAEYHRQEMEKHRHAIQLLEQEHLWDAYHEMLDARARMLWSQRGIFDGWQDEWKLGVNWDFEVWFDDSGTKKSYHSPALSIPIWQAERKIANIKMRVLEPIDSSHRYRQIYRTGNAHLFVARQDMPMTGKLALVEGEIKAMVVAQYLDDRQVIGLPSKSPDPTLYEQLSGFDDIVLCLDPDAFIVPPKAQVSAVQVAVNELGKERTRILQLPAKIDDLINSHGANAERLIRQARRL